VKVAIDVRRAGDYGVGTYIRNIVQELGRLATPTRYVLIGRSAERAHFDSLPEKIEWAECRSAPRSLRDQWEMPYLLRHSRADLLHVPWLYAPLNAGRPVVMTVHDLTEWTEPVRERRMLQAVSRRLARRALARAARVLAVSQSTQREVARVFALPEDRIEVVYNALDERFVVEPPPGDCARILERHAVYYPYVLYAGSVQPQKNLPRLVEAFAVVKTELAEHPELRNLKLIVIGDDLARHQELRRSVVKTRMQEEVRFLGFVPHGVLRAFYAHARVFAFPSLDEGFGLPPLEAMAHGTPVVASNVSSLPEVCGEAALGVHPENVFDIARGLRAALTDDSLRRELIARGRERVQLFSWRRAALAVHQTYWEVATTTKKSPAR
jgi:glycosyltransferase involved in cell wall biosynthesis